MFRFENNTCLASSRFVCMPIRTIVSRCHAKSSCQMKKSNRIAEVNTSINGDAIADNTSKLNKPLPLLMVGKVVSEI
jgi:hypothetical protein